ncbi:MAG: GNAT family N-acetyltransferase [Phycisphaerae bacterium]|jgi:putative acetyltransferase|nr:GNAT family N-acetyltransferase [Phycisphaerae bacterium]
MNIKITEFSPADYEDAYALWTAIPGIGLDLDDADSREQVLVYLARNPGLSFVARDSGRVVGAVLCGHDGRRGYMHHLAVDPAYRGSGIAKALVTKCMDGLEAAGIRRCNIFIYGENEEGQAFWKNAGWSTFDGLVLMYKNVR